MQMQRLKYLNEKSAISETKRVFTMLVVERTWDPPVTHKQSLANQWTFCMFPFHCAPTSASSLGDKLFHKICLKWKQQRTLDPNHFDHISKSSLMAHSSEHDAYWSSARFTHVPAMLTVYTTTHGPLKSKKDELAVVAVGVALSKANIVLQLQNIKTSFFTAPVKKTCCPVLSWWQLFLDG